MENKNASKIFDLAAELGAELKKDERLERLADARHNFDNDKILSKLVMEYNVQNMAIDNVTADGQADPVLIGEIQKRIDEIYAQIEANPVYRELQAAQDDVNELMNSVNNTIMFNITGELPKCTHDCSSCGGGCSH